MKSKLAPPSDNKGRGSARIYTTKGLSQMIVVGALFSAGLELTPAARLGGAISDEFCSIYGHIPERLDDLAEPMLSTHPFLLDLPSCEYGAGRDRFALYGFICEHSNNYRPGAICRGDMFVEIIDRRFVFFGNYDMPNFVSPFSAEPSDVSAAYRIAGWERGSSGVNVIPLSDELPPIGVRPASEEAIEAWKRAGAKIEAEYFLARGKAVSATRVNISLAIRNGFDAVIQHRSSGISDR
ncbi:hypothetical protein AncyloWKF20_08650 [Ancylobacter sp. WKF20]|uniref:hypothetical protein n=1 Tax=Ancylobacter sp. WKF20 TaxID=3039801 RepID=UPI002434211D|nr:hypothetical protein [Ancylobacter sp. WKF20]WGD31872.1 hypothetical protein AncyloWKF20_08650 [Ancylobacter sp. WKF20]